jgi:D-alanine-D-alanine ligase
VLGAIDRTKFEVVAVAISRSGQMFLHSADPSDIDTAHGLPEVSEAGRRVVLSTDPTIRGFIALDGGDVPPAFQSVDVVFPVLHGPYGEDGTLQGSLQFAGIACVGSGVFASACAMDKVHMKMMLQSHGLPTGDFVGFHREHWQTDAQEVVESISRLGLPVFIKPARAGSSIGITKVHSPDALAPAIETALEHDSKVIAEAAISHMREIECGVLVDNSGAITSSVAAEIVVRGNHEFYDFEAKYLEDSAELHVPASVSQAELQAIQNLARDAFLALGCEGFARVDFFLKSDGTLLVNEVNTLPGFTEISMFPRMWQASGMSYSEIITALVQDALRREGSAR